MAARKLEITKTSLTKQIEDCNKAGLNDASNSLQILRDYYFKPNHYAEDFIFTASNGDAKLMQLAPEMKLAIDWIEIHLKAENIQKALQEIKKLKTKINK